MSPELKLSLKKGNNYFGTSYAKASNVAVKGDYCNKTDLPVDEKYRSEMKDRFLKPKIRSCTEEKELKEKTKNKREYYFFGEND